MMVPWQLELQADVVALGTVGEPLRYRGQRLLRVTLTDVLEGQATLGAIFPEDAAPWLGCLPPRRIDRPSRRLSEGQDVLVYLTENAEGRLSILRIDEAPQSVDHLREFFALESKLEDPEVDWQEIFAEEVRGLDAMGYWILRWGPLPEAATPALMAALERAGDWLESDTEAGQEVHQIARLVELANHSNDPRLLPALHRLVESQLASDRPLTGGLLAHSRLLAQLEADAAVRWGDSLSYLLERSLSERNVSLYQQTAHGLAALPGDVGVPTLIDGLDDHRSELVAALIHRRQSWTDAQLRERLHAKARRLLTAPGLQGDEHLTFRRHLEWLLGEF